MYISIFEKHKGPPLKIIDDYKFIVIGTGLAGLAFSLKVAQLGKVALLSKEELTAANSTMAQGGIAAVISDEDSFDKHIKDTITAGAGLCNPEVVKQVISQGAERIQDLTDWGVKFDLQGGGNDFALTREGGHSERRILHIKDYTGLGIHQSLLKRAQENPNIDLLENEMAIDLITKSKEQSKDKECVGIYSLNKSKNEIHAFQAPVTVLATGGAGKVYMYTSNWSGATGDGLAMAERAGAQLNHLEFMQFHPTCLYHPDARNFLISEALRGEGGKLINSAGERFMTHIHELGELAPRDIVARSIDAELKKTGKDCVFLDMRHMTQEQLENRFPQIFNKCLSLNINIAEQPIPVVPAAHHLCGGVVTSINGESNINSLFALGETAQTGLHGANRLASNSLLECMVFAHNAAKHIKENQEIYFKNKERFQISPWKQNYNTDPDEMIVVTHMWEEIRRLMWNYVGILRSNLRLKRAKSRLQNINKEIKDHYSNFKITSDLLELRNIALVAEKTVDQALERKESRGIHYNIDYPFAD